MTMVTDSDVTNVQDALDLGLLKEEYEQICQRLGRHPNFTELSIYSVMWSEHCSYKNSIKWLKTLPRSGKHMLAEAGEENAGLVDIGDGLACAFKIESHNHPSAVEPYQGAATGVGGINRDIFTMGARPIAQLNSLRFGNLETERTKWLMKGVVKGIGDYGNSFGVPVLGGEVSFDPCFEQNCLVNAMSVGIVKTGHQISATSEGPGNPVFIVGSSTGKDGIHGAAFASKNLSEDSAADLPAVQVGDPFMEKLLLEASLELAKTDAVVGMQDMGAAGITCSSSEMSEKGGCGMNIWLDKVPLRQQDMSAWEILLSESQERMLVVIHKGKEQVAFEIFKKWDLNCVQIGEVSEGNTLRYFKNDLCVAELPADHLVLGGGAPVYTRDYKEPGYISRVRSFNPDQVSIPENLSEVGTFLLKHENIAAKDWVIEQYDSMVGTINMSTNGPADAGIVNLKESNKALALTVDCNPRYVYLDPKEGAAMAVAEAARNIRCSGGIPSAITNCLNFGNPYDEGVYWQFVGAVTGMGKACKVFGTPVTGGNVSFYNQMEINGKMEAVYPTPDIGMVGIIEDKKHITTIPFKSASDRIFLLGRPSDDIGGSEYLYAYHKIKYSSAPVFNLEEEKRMHICLSDIIHSGLINAAHDCADGGLFITLCEMAFGSKIGFRISTPENMRPDGFLFGEAQGRVVICCSQDREKALSKMADKHGVPLTPLGTTGGDALCINENNWMKVEEAGRMFRTALGAQFN